MRRGSAGPRSSCRGAEPGWCLPEWGCVCPEPLQHLCIRMCSSLSSLLACALPRSLPTTTPIPGEGIFFFPSAFTSLATVQGPVRAACSVMHNACLSLPAPSGAPNPIPMGLEQVWGRGVKSLLYGVGAAPATVLCWGHPPLCSVSIYKHSPVPEYMCVTVGVHNWVYVQAAEIAL